MTQRNADQDPWPALPYYAWRDTHDTLHLWAQIVGKIRMSLTPWLNHSWHVTLYVTARGLTASPIFCEGKAFQIDFDFINQVLRIDLCDGARRVITLRPCYGRRFLFGNHALLSGPRD
jgi:hypothetical protein